MAQTNPKFGPHLGDGEMCAICKAGQASHQLHCSWCGTNFATKQAYSDHMYGPESDCFENMSSAIKSVVNTVYPADTQGERNWQDFVHALMEDKLWRLRMNAHSTNTYRNGQQADADNYKHNGGRF